jgi:hypothetical protein
MHSNLLLCHRYLQVPVPIFHDMMRINSCKHLNTRVLKTIKTVKFMKKYMYKWEPGSTWGWILFVYLLYVIYIKSSSKSTVFNDYWSFVYKSHLL